MIITRLPLSLPGFNTCPVHHACMMLCMQLPCCLLATCHMCARGAPPVLATLLATACALISAMAVRLAARFVLHTMPRAPQAGVGKEHYEPTPAHSTALGLPEVQQVRSSAAAGADPLWPLFFQCCHRRPNVGQWLADCCEESGQAWGRGDSSDEAAGSGPCGHLLLACCGGESLRDATCKAFVKHLLPVAPDAHLHLFGV